MRRTFSTHCSSARSAASVATRATRVASGSGEPPLCKAGSIRLLENRSGAAGGLAGGVSCSDVRSIASGEDCSAGRARWSMPPVYRRRSSGSNTPPRVDGGAALDVFGYPAAVMFSGIVVDGKRGYSVGPVSWRGGETRWPDANDTGDRAEL